MRNMSFSLTQEQARTRTKDVTRRQHWDNLKPGDMIQQIVKGQGLKKGQHVEKIHIIRIISVQAEHVDDIVSRWYRDGKFEAGREGFPQWVGQEWRFVEMYCKANKCRCFDDCDRIEFEYVEDYA